jgi:hypothetical protein
VLQESNDRDWNREIRPKVDAFCLAAEGVASSEICFFDAGGLSSMHVSLLSLDGPLQ